MTVTEMENDIAWSYFLTRCGLFYDPLIFVWCYWTQTKQFYMESLVLDSVCFKSELQKLKPVNDRNVHYTNHLPDLG